MRKLALLILALGMRSVFAFTPTPGLWFNPNESGRGYTIDIQDNNIMVVTAYVYDAAHNATWFLASGNYAESVSTFTGTLGAYSGGQCFGCPYVSPTGVGKGVLQVTFTSPETGTLYYPGGSTPIQHEIYGYASKLDYLGGEWSFTTFIAGGVYDTVWVIFSGATTVSNGTTYLVGSEDSLSGTAAVGQYDAASGLFIVVLNDNVGFSHAFAMTGDDRRMLGAGEIFPSSETPPNPTEVAAGSRLLFEAELTSKAEQKLDLEKIQALTEIANRISKSLIK